MQENLERHVQNLVTAVIEPLVEKRDSVSPAYFNRVDKLCGCVSVVIISFAYELTISYFG